MVRRGILRENVSFQEHRTLHHTLIGVLAGHLGLGSRKLREVGDLDDTGEKTVGTPTYCHSLHQRRTGSLTFGPSSGTVGEQRSKGDVVLGRELADR